MTFLKSTLCLNLHSSYALSNFSKYPDAKMKPLLGKFSPIDAHFIAVIWIVCTYAAAVAVMFFVVPGRPHYFYSLISSTTSDRMDVGFLIFFMFEIYAKTAQAFVDASVIFSIFPTLLPAAFWMKYFRRLAQTYIHICISM